jgi:hypothetical protein
MAGIGGADRAQPQRLGYLGLGMMGLPMTRRLIDAGHDVTVWNRSHHKAAALVEAGATAAAHPREVAIHPDAARSIAARLKAANGMGWIDAPVSGGTKGAEEGTLAVMAGGDAADIEKVRPYVLAMARRLTHMGPVGAGQTTKLCNQVIVGCAMAVLAEATRLATNAGIDAQRLPEALAGGFADSIPLQLFVPRMAAHGGGDSFAAVRPYRHHAQGPGYGGRCRPRHIEPRADGGAGRAIVQNGEGGARRRCRRAGNLQAVGLQGWLREAVAMAEKPIAATPGRVRNSLRTSPH